MLRVSLIWKLLRRMFQVPSDPDGELEEPSKLASSNVATRLRVVPIPQNRLTTSVFQKKIFQFSSN